MMPDQADRHFVWVWTLMGSTPMEWSIVLIMNVCSWAYLRNHSPRCHQIFYVCWCILTWWFAAASVEHFPEHPTSYLLDVIKDTLTRTKDFYLLVQRTSWFYPLHLDSGNQTYINMMYQQIRPDFLDGNMLVVPNKSLTKSLRVSFFTL